ncbi:hypothetical protein CSW58_03790 [Caulobacter sp. B11]|uniref:hypothetical protein n=1 Tax=Caulobacter sp. B11 TaxID=2048899 RepID=UPI000C12B9DA|nr:hypothetical protein [Caulobacter sp. B11]PHY13739.1 hypothetical protein CSW58_03790 [Caulobacter sp. B11]
MAWEKVYTVDDVHDGPRAGIADFRGCPHVYELVFDDDIDEFTSQYRLAEASPELFDLAMESWAIWLRWAAAFQSGEVVSDAGDGFGALAEDQQRRDQLRVSIGDRLRVGESANVVARAQFRGQISPWADDLEVCWLIEEGDRP